MSPFAGCFGEVLISLTHCCSTVLQAIWAKGYTELLNLVEKDGAIGEMHTAIDCYGYGDDLHEVGLHWLLGGLTGIYLHVLKGLLPHSMPGTSTPYGLM